MPLDKAEITKQKKSSIISDVVFYVFLVGLFIAVFILGTGGGTGDIFGFSYANVLTSSMQSEIPRGSFVLIRTIDPADVNVGDDITFFSGRDVTVTHRVMRIYENYNDSGERGFITQGIENDFVDTETVRVNNFIGRVQFHIPHLGSALAFISDNALLFGGMFVCILLLTTTLKIFFGERRKERKARASAVSVLELMDDFTVSLPQSIRE